MVSLLPFLPVERFFRWFPSPLPPVNCLALPFSDWFGSTASSLPLLREHVLFFLLYSPSHRRCLAFSFCLGLFVWLGSIPENISLAILKAVQSIYPMQNVYIRKVKALKKPKFDRECRIVSNNGRRIAQSSGDVDKILV